MVFKLFFGNEVTAAGTVEGVGTATGSSTAAAGATARVTRFTVQAPLAVSVVTARNQLTVLPARLATVAPAAAAVAAIPAPRCRRQAGPAAYQAVAVAVAAQPLTA